MPRKEFGGGGGARPLADGAAGLPSTPSLSLLPVPQFSLREAIPPRLLPPPIPKTGGSYLPSIQGGPAERLLRPLRPSPGLLSPAGVPGCTYSWLAGSLPRRLSVAPIHPPLLADDALAALLCEASRRRESVTRGRRAEVADGRRHLVHDGIRTGPNLLWGVWPPLGEGQGKEAAWWESQAGRARRPKRTGRRTSLLQKGCWTPSSVPCMTSVGWSRIWFFPGTMGFGVASPYSYCGTPCLLPFPDS